MESQLDLAEVKLQATTWSKAGTNNLPVLAAAVPSHTNPTRPAPRCDALPMHPDMAVC